MLTKLFNGIFFIGKFIGDVGNLVKNISIYLHLKYKTPTGIKIAAALEVTKQQLTLLKAQLEQQEQGAENNENFRSFFVNNKPSDS